MNILLVTEFFPDIENPIFSGGVETRIYYTAIHLAKKHKVTVLARKKSSQTNLQSKGNLKIHHLGSPISQSSATLNSIFSRLQFITLAIKKSKSINIDIVEGSNFVSMIPAFIIGKTKKIPQISWYPDVLIGHWTKQFGPILGLIGEATERILTKLPWDHYITISEAAQERLQKTNITKEKISVIPCGIEKNKSKQIQKKSQLLIVSRLVPYKRVDWAIKLLKNLKKPKLNLVIVGAGPEEEKLKQLTTTFRLNKRVKFLKNISQTKKKQLLCESTLLLHPSLIEGFGIVLVEAAANGTPFIASDIPTSIALKKSLNSGLTFKQGSMEDFTIRTKKLLKDKKLWNKLSTSGITNSKKYEWEKLAEKTESIYEKILKKY